MNLRTALVAAFTFVVAAPIAYADISHAKFGEVLKKYVSGGKVDYVGLRADQGTLDEYLKAVATASEPKLDTKTLAGMSFYINAYNALVMKAVVIQDPLPKNITDDKAFFEKTKHKIAGKEMTLNEIEGKIRKEFKDARIHFAFNCAAVSCPPLPGTPFEDKSIDATLTKLTQNFLNGGGIKIDDTKKEIQVTKLMDWYGADFSETLGDSALAKDKAAIQFSTKYITDATKKASFDAAVAAGYKVTYRGYNWNPNAK